MKACVIILYQTSVTIHKYFSFLLKVTTTTYAYTESGDIILQQHVTGPYQQDEAAASGTGSLGAMSRQARKKLDKQEKLNDLKCGMCGFQGKSWKHLETHLMTHSNYRPFKCKECGKGEINTGCLLKGCFDTFLIDLICRVQGAAEIGQASSDAHQRETIQVQILRKIIRIETQQGVPRKGA